MSKKEILSLSENIIDEFNKSTLLFQGDLFNKGSHSKYYIYKNIIFVTNDDTIVTIWKIFYNNEDKVKEILSLKDLSLKLNSEQDALNKKCYSLSNTKQHLLSQNSTNTNTIANINKERKKTHKDYVDLKYAIEALNVAINQRCRYLIRGKKNTYIDLIEFYTTTRNCKNESKIKRLELGFEYLRNNNLFFTPIKQP